VKNQQFIEYAERATAATTVLKAENSPRSLRCTAQGGAPK
jgi:hypothetical protein